MHTITLIAEVSPDNAYGKSVTWSSSKESVATVDQNGKVTAVSAGTATITVTTTDRGKTATCAVTVCGVNGEWVEGRLTATACVSEPAKALLVAAVYDGNGKLVSVEVIPLEAGKVSYPAGITAEASDHTCKLMLVDKSSYAPLFEAWSENA